MYVFSVHVYVFLLLPNKFPWGYIKIVSKGINVHYTSALKFKDLIGSVNCSSHVRYLVHLKRERERERERF